MSTIDSVYVLFVVATAATHGRRGAALLSVAAALLVLLGRIQLAWEGVLPFHARHITDSLYYALLFLLAGNTTAFLIRKSREPALLRALHDPLTGLPHRLLLDDRLRQTILQAERIGESFALLFLDLDNFKAVNDNWGHSAGDSVLQEVASRLRATFRESDTVASIGGEEFAVLLPWADEAAAGLATSKILAALHDPIQAGKAQVIIRASIGSAIYPHHGSTKEALIAVADAAMYTAKRARPSFPQAPPSAHTSF